ncbi:unnamed protein product [Lactuca saligna]|uniref:Uncharacterized protein n=1 Tax=Lactuca saligna TaxID=75948 RepID=A0AA35VU03_LACSI|nr:unnamed protein product [Lactuca saligna]
MILVWENKVKNADDKQGQGRFCQLGLSKSTGRPQKRSCRASSSFFQYRRLNNRDVILIYIDKNAAKIVDFGYLSVCHRHWSHHRPPSQLAPIPCTTRVLRFVKSSKMTEPIYPEDAIPWVGLYVCLASLISTLAMAADAFQGFRKRKLWFPCRFFTINAASLTLIAIAMKLPVDLNTDMSPSKAISIAFLVAMVGNFLPSLGLMDGKDLLLNMIAFGILMITITVNVWLQYSTIDDLRQYGILRFMQEHIIRLQMFMLICSLPWPFSVALTIPVSRKILQHRYKELHRLTSNHQEINFSYKELKHKVKKYWMMAETGDPQFAVACSPISSAFGVICLSLAFSSVYFFLDSGSYRSNYVFNSRLDSYEKSEYKWSMKLIVIMQTVGTIVGSIAPILRCLTSISHFDLSKKWTKNHLNLFKVEKYWTQTLQLWKHNHVGSGIPSRHCKKLLHQIKNMILNFCIALQILVVVICKTICLIPRSFLILFFCCCYFCKSLMKRFKQEPNASDSIVIPDMEEYIGYVLQTEAEAKLSKNMLRNSFNSITRILHESEEKEPRYLMKLLKKSTGFNGVLEFDNDEVPPVHPEEIQNCWSLVAVTLTAIALSLPNIANDQVNELLSSVSEGLQFVRHIEESLNTNGELVKARKAASHVWTDVEVYYRWLQIDLQARNGETSEEILEWLGDEAVQIVIQFKRSKYGGMDHSVLNAISASSTYRISQTILLHCKKQENWPTDEELFEFISTIIADLLCACFTNLPRVITMKCHEHAIEERENSIRTAAQLLGRSKKILKILKARQLPNLDMDSIGYIDKWHALPKSQIPNCCFSSARSQLASSSSSESIEITVV